MSEQKNYTQFTLSHKPELVISGLLGRSAPKVRTITTKKGPAVKTEFSIKVDLARGEDGSYSKEACYLNVSVFGDYTQQLARLGQKKWPRIAVGGYLNAREEGPKPDGGFWPARLDFNAQRLYFGEEAEAEPVAANEASASFDI